MPSSKCKHPRRHVTVTTHCFRGPVSDRENPLAHGGVCDHYRCAKCGAEREINHNCGETESSGWYYPAR